MLQENLRKHGEINLAIEKVHTVADLEDFPLTNRAVRDLLRGVIRKQWFVYVSKQGVHEGGSNDGFCFGTLSAATRRESVG